MRNTYLMFSLLIFIGASAYAQTAPTQKVWDLSYESVLNHNDIKWDHSQGTLFTWLKHRDQEHQVISEFIQRELNKEPEAAFLIDHPTFPSAGRTTILGIRNQDGCFYFWRSTDEKMREFKKSPMTPEMFTKIFNRLHTLKQRGYESMGGPEKAYAGFLSTYLKGNSKQLLLHIHDFLEFDVQNQEILRAGRIFQIENSLQVNNQ